MARDVCTQLFAAYTPQDILSVTESGLSSVTDSPKAMRSLTNIFGKMRGYNDQKYATPPRIIKVDAPENIALIENAYNEGVRTKGTVRTKD